MRPDIKVWNPENPAQWNKTLAWTTVWLSTFSLTFGFCAWFLVPSLAYPALLLGVRRSARRYPLLGPSRFCFVKWHRRRNLFRLDGLY